MRKALHPNIEAIKKVAPEVQIMPEHEVTLGEILKEFEKTKRGPGKYEPSHKLVEARQDVGV